MAINKRVENNELPDKDAWKCYEVVILSTSGIAIYIISMGSLQNFVIQSLVKIFLLMAEYILFTLFLDHYVRNSPCFL